MKVKHLLGITIKNVLFWQEVEEMADVRNHDIVGMYNRMNRFLVEVLKSVSADVSEVNVFDQNRLETYLGAIDAYHDWVVAQPQLDLPETAPRTYTLADPPEIYAVENENANDIIRLLIIARDELTNSQSAREPSGFNTFDSNRLRAITDKCRKFLETYIKPVTPLDFPESSPAQPTTGPGRGGI